MNELYIAGVFVAGFITGSIFFLIVYKILSNRNRAEFKTVVNEAAELMKSSFANISMEAISKTTDIISNRLQSEREISSKELSGQKEVIEKRIEVLTNELSRLMTAVNGMEKSRSMQTAELKSIIEDSRIKATELYRVTNSLSEVLSSKQGRGQWAERMADDVLSFAGLKEGVNYVRQKKMDNAGGRPDFTFFLPNGSKLNMDVKFPYENYKKYIETDESNKEYYAKEFIKDVKKHIKAISGREYIDTSAGTVNCAIMFIPNEKIYSFIFDTDAEVLDEASKLGIMMCSPVTTISVLAVIRQASENFVIEKKAKDLMSAISVFRKEWIKYSESFYKLGDYIGKASSEYETLRTTRSNKLESSMNKLESLKDDEIA